MFVQFKMVQTARFVIFLLMLDLVVCQSHNGHMEGLMDSLFPKDDRKVLAPPGTPGQLPVRVSIGFMGKAVSFLNLREQVFNLHGALSIKWYDPRMTWDSGTYGNVSKILVPASMVWRPDLVFSNVLKDDYDDILGNDKLPLKLDAYGQIVWDVWFSSNFICKVDASKYPFDVSICLIDIMPWASDNETIKLVCDDYSGRSGMLNTSSQFDVAVEELIVNTTSTNGLHYDVLRIPLRFKRRPMLVIVNLLLPIVILSILCSSSFMLHPEEPEKLNLSTTTLLSVILFLGTAADTMPQDADNISLLVVYVFIVMCQGFLAVLGNVFIITQKLAQDKDQELKQTSERAIASFQGLAQQCNTLMDGPAVGWLGEVQVKAKDAISKSPPQNGSAVTKADTLNKLFFRVSCTISVSVTALFWIFILL